MKKKKKKKKKKKHDFFPRLWVCIYDLSIMKTCLYNFDPLKRHFYIVKLGLIGVYIFFYFCPKQIMGTLESPNYTVPTIYVFRRNMKIFIFFFYLKIFVFWW